MILENTVINDVLCYISTARSSVPEEVIILTVRSFYDFDKIKKAKDFLCKVCGVKTNRRRNDDKITTEIGDILKLFEDACVGDKEIPKFVAEGYTSMPPSSGFEIVSEHILSLTNEIEQLKLELKQFRKIREDYSKVMDDSMDLKLEVSDIKKLLLSSGNNLSGRSNVEFPPDFLRPSNLFEHHSIKGTENVSKPISYADAIMSGKSINHSRQSSDISKNRLQSSIVPPASSSSQEVRFPARNRENRAFNAHQRTRGLVGTRCFVSADGFGAVSDDRIMDIYVGRCSKRSVPQELVDYCKNECNIQVHECTELVTKSVHFKAFKISVKMKDRNGLLNPELWPEGILVRKYFSSRVTYRPSNNDQGFGTTVGDNLNYSNASVSQE